MRFPNAAGALIYPIYGEGELPQAFCRRVTVKGCIYVLRMPVISLLLDKLLFQVARGICVTRSSIKPDVSNCLVGYPTRSLYPEQVTSIRALQLGSNLAVCPLGTLVLYFSTLCHDANEGKKLLQAAMNALLTLPVSGIPESDPTIQSDCADIKPIVIWSAFYIQKVKMLFHQMCPNEVFFPETKSTEDAAYDDGLTLVS